MSDKIEMLPVPAGAGAMLKFREEYERQIAGIFYLGGRRSGKCAEAAAMVAEKIKAGHAVYAVSVDTAGNALAECIVGVPGYDDGRQLAGKSRNSD